MITYPPELLKILHCVKNEQYVWSVKVLTKRRLFLEELVEYWKNYTIKVVKGIQTKNDNVPSGAPENTSLRKKRARRMVCQSIDQTKAIFGRIRTPENTSLRKKRARRMVCQSIDQTKAIFGRIRFIFTYFEGRKLLPRSEDAIKVVKGIRTKNGKVLSGSPENTSLRKKRARCMVCP
ncbi:hypothetical protein NPIL_501671 [Nephila pilipes]|uniref:Uncharacterized protein n=1 Tax=Nephila pilipes TaxID=299642 RepID=A0A8X6PXM2_NEPPI|nr:hypothetical protein NPIL_501671 [Nephila pilipes]